MLRRNHEDGVRVGALLRIASDLLVPCGELDFDRFQLIEWLAQLGIAAGPGANRFGWFWVEDACPGPEPKDEILILRRHGDEWIVGYWERGQFDVRHRFSEESDACRWMLHHVVSHNVTSMGTVTVPPHVRVEYREAVLAALEEVAELIRNGPVAR